MNSHSDFAMTVYGVFDRRKHVYTDTNGQKGDFYFKNVNNYIYVTDNFLKSGGGCAY